MKTILNVSAAVLFLALSATASAQTTGASDDSATSKASPISGIDVPEATTSPSGVVQHNQTDLEFIKKIATSSIGDPDFDLLRATQPPASIGDVDRDGAVDKTVPTVSNEGRDRTKDSDASAGRAITGDPDFDLLNISLGGDDLEKFRADVSSGGTKKVTVRGWDPEKKEEIVGRPQDVKTSEDLRVYVEAVALSDAAIKGIKIENDVIEVESREPGKLFGFIPIEMSSRVIVRYTLRDSTEDRVSVWFPWWHFFVVKKGYTADMLETELSLNLDTSVWQKIDNSEMPTGVSSIASALRSVSSVMKTKHDTVKNSVSNIR